jgi:hypothetical protein
MEEKEKISKEAFIIIGIISVIILTIVIVAVVINANTKPEVIKETKDGAEITLNYGGENSDLALTDMKITKNEDGIKIDAADQRFDFTVNTEMFEANSAEYEIFVTKNKKKCNVEDNYLILYLEKESDGTFNKVIDPKLYNPLKKKDKMGVTSGNMVLFKDTVNSSKAINYRLRMWLSDKYVVKEGEILNCTVTVGIKGEAK